MAPASTQLQLKLWRFWRLHRFAVRWTSRLRHQLIFQLHKGHPGIVCMKALGQCYMWWPNLNKDILECVLTCPQCQESTLMPARDHPREWKDPRAPWSRLHIDLVGPLQGQSFLIVADAFSKWVEVVLMHSTTSETVIRAL